MEKSNIDNNLENKDITISCRSCCGRRLFPVFLEPIMILYYMSHLPALKMRSQFLYDKLARDNGLYSSTNTTHGSSSNCDLNQSSPDYDLQIKVQAEAADWQIYLTFVIALPAMLSVLYIGPYSDRGGRKIAILMSSVGVILNACGTVLIIYFDLSVPWLLIPNFLEGILGYSEGFRMGCFSILSDVTTAKNRSFRMTVLESAYVITGGMTNLALGYVIKDTGFLIPYAFTGAVQVVNIVIIIFVIPEVAQNSQEDVQTRLISWIHFKRVAQLIRGDLTQGGKMKLYLLLFAFLVYRVLFGGKISVETLYQLNTPLCWNSIKIGYFGMVSDVVFGVVGILVVPLLQVVPYFHRPILLIIALVFGKRCCRLVDGQMIMIGTVTAIVQGLFEAFARTQTMMFIVPLLGFGMVMATALYRATFSKLVGSDKTGVIFAGVAVLELLTYLVAGTLFNAIYSATLSIVNGGFIFLLSAGLACLSLIFVTIYSLKYEYWKCLANEPTYVPVNSSPDDP